LPAFATGHSKTWRHARDIKERLFPNCRLLMQRLSAADLLFKRQVRAGLALKQLFLEQASA
jgi:hypothetical protein